MSVVLTTYKYFVLNANEQAQKKIALYAENYLKQNCKLICLNSCDSEGTDKTLTLLPFILTKHPK